MGIRSLIQIIILTFTLNIYAELGNESFDLKNYRAGGMTDGGSCGVITPEGDLRLKDYILFNKTHPKSHRPGDIIESHKFLDVVELNGMMGSINIKTLPSYANAIESLDAWSDRYPIEIQALKKQLEVVNIYGVNYRFGHGISNCTKDSEAIIALYAKSPIEEFSDGVFISITNFSKLSFIEQTGVFIKEAFRGLQFQKDSPLKIQNLEKNISKAVYELMFLDPQKDNIEFNEVLHNGFAQGSIYETVYQIADDIIKAKKDCAKLNKSFDCELDDEFISRVEFLSNYPPYQYNLNKRKFYKAFAEVYEQLGDFYRYLNKKERNKAFLREAIRFYNTAINLNDRAARYSLDQATIDSKKLKTLMFPEKFAWELKRCKSYVNTFTSCLPFVIRSMNIRLRPFNKRYLVNEYNKSLREVFAADIEK